MLLYLRLLLFSSWAGFAFVSSGAGGLRQVELPPFETSGASLMCIQQWESPVFVLLAGLQRDLFVAGVAWSFSVVVWLSVTPGAIAFV